MLWLACNVYSVASKSEIDKSHQYTFIVLRFKFAIAQQSFITCNCLHRQIVSSDGLQFTTFAASTIILSCLKNQIWLDKEVWVAIYIFKYFRDISKHISWKMIWIRSIRSNLTRWIHFKMLQKCITILAHWNFRWKSLCNWSLLECNDFSIIKRINTRLSHLSCCDKFLKHLRLLKW